MENISGDASDPFYRYKMPSLTAQNQSNKTVITNLSEVAKAISRPEEDLMKMFGYRRQAKSSFKKGTAFLGGKHLLSDLKEDLRWYIKTYVLCRVCSNPETIIIVSKSGKIKLVCQACPETSTVKDGDQKLNKWISQNNKN